MSKVERFGDFEVDHRVFQIRWRGNVVPVERRVFDLISYLLLNCDRVVTKEELFEHVWQGRVVSAGSLTVAVAAARRALRDDPKNPQIIITHHGRGYRFHLGESVERRDPSGVHLGGAGSFVGRSEELRQLGELLRTSATGRPGLAVIVGEAGIGKSRLVDEFAKAACSTGTQAVHGRCREEEGAPPYWPWIQIARELCASEANREAGLQLAREAPEIARSVPGLSDSAESLVTNLPPSNARFKLFDAFARFVDAVSRQGTLAILLDDVHRADIDSLLMLDFLADALRVSRLVVVATHRPGELVRSRNRFEILARTIRKVSGLSLQLRGLSTDDVSRLVRDVGGWSPTLDQAKALEELTGGNPFFLGQLTSILGSEGVELNRAASKLPLTVRDAIAQHLEGLPETTVTLLRTAAVMGREFDLRVLASAQGGTPLEILSRLHDAIEAEIVSSVRGDDDVYRFAHVLVRDVLYQGLGGQERARLHASIGEALERCCVGGATPLAEVAHHYSEAAIEGNVDRAIAACCAAAAGAREGVAYGEAVLHYQEALSVLEKFKPDAGEQICSILLALGSDQVRAGDRDGAKGSFDRAARIAEAMGSPERVAVAALGISPGFFAVEAGEHDELLVTLLRRSRSRLGEAHLQLRALVLARLGMALFWTDRDGECARLSREAWGIASSQGDPGLQLPVLMARWVAEWTPYAVDERSAIANEAIALARSLEDKEALAVALLLGLVCSLETGRIEVFDEFRGEFERLAGELRQPQALWYSRLIGAARDLHAGRFIRAEEGAIAYSEIGRRIGDANASLSRMAQGLVLASERGDARAILAISEEAHRLYPLFFGWRASRCWALARAGDVDGSKAALSEIRSLGLRSVPRKLDWPTAMVLLAETALLLRDQELAEELYELLLPLRGRLLVLGFCVMTWGPVSRYLGLLCETLGRYSEAVDWYEQGIAEARRSNGSPWEAHASFGLFRVTQHIQSSRGGSREAARSALGIAQRLEMRHLESEVLTALGAG